MDIYIDDNNRSSRKQKIKKDIEEKNIKNKDVNNREDILVEVLKLLNFSNSPSRFSKIIEILTPYLEDNPKDILFNKIMGYSLMENGFYDEADKYFQKILLINRNDVESMNALAYIELVKNNLQSAVNYILDALYIDKDNKILKKNLDMLKNVKDVKLFISKVRPSDFIFIELPKFSVEKLIEIKLKEFFKSPILKWVSITVIILFSVILLFKIYPILNSWIDNLKFKYNFGRNVVLEYSIKDIDQLLQERSRYKINIPPNEVKIKYEMIRNYIYEKKYNHAIMLINEVLNSDTTEYVKEQVRFLQDFIPDITPDNLDFNPSCRDILKIPVLYKNVYVRWNGMVVNLLKSSSKETAFDLLINFVNDAVVDGIAYVHFRENINLKNGDRIIIFGKVAGLTDNNKIVLQGINFQKIGK